LKLRPYQSKTIETIKRKFWGGVNRQLVKWSTGLGKTCLATALPDALPLTKRMLFLVHRDELAQQTESKMRKWNPTRTIGVEMGDRRAGDAQIVIASVQSIGKAGSPRLLQFKPEDFQVIVTDEVHHGVSQSYRTIYDHFDVKNNKEILHVGLTATPNRADGKGLNEILDEIVFDMGILDGIRQGWLADLRGIRVSSDTSLDSVGVRAGDFALEELSSTINVPVRNDLVVRAWLEHGKDRQSLVFATDIAHAKELAKAFRSYGVAAQEIYGADPDRAAKLKFHREGHIKVLVNADLLIEGYDDWRIGCIVLAKPTKSETRYVQIIGRGTRIPEGIDNLLRAREMGLHIEKEDCILIDVVDATTKHSLVSLPSLFGLNEKMNLRGAKITAVMEEVAKLKEEKPFVDLTKVDDVKNLRTYAEQVDLFKVTFAPEIIQISEYQWHKTGHNAYVLLLTKGESVTVVSDLLGDWHIIGEVNGVQLSKRMANFEEAIREADYQVQIHGGRGLASIAKRKASWSNDPPTPGQLIMAKRFRISVPPGATKGELHQAINREMAKRKKAA
jgi:ATP-dependent helicase IRC3